MKLRNLLICLVCMLILAPAAFSKEGGDQYPNGAESWGTGMLPPPGTFAYLNYFVLYNGELRDGSGNKVNLGGSTPTAWAVANAFRPVYMSNVKLFGGNMGWYAVVPVVDQQIKLGPTESNSGIGDITVQPFFLAWHRKNIHWAAVVDLNLPTGYFDASNPRTSIGAGYFAVEPAVAITFLPKSGWEASTKIMYDINRTNHSDQYKSGQDFHFDYVVGKHIGPATIGASGYYFKQTTNDTVNGQVLAAAPGLYSQGRKGQVFAIGPNIGITNNRYMQLMVSYTREMAVRNRFGGDKLMVKLIIPTRIGLFPRMKKQ